MTFVQQEPGFDFFKLAGDQADQVFFVFDLSTRQFFYLNTAFEKIWKRPSQQVLAHPASLLDSLHAEDKGYMVESFQQFVAPGVKNTVEFRISLPDQSEKWIRLWAYPIPEENKPRFAAGIAEDDSARKNNFFTMQQLHAKKSSILEILSHDLKAPFFIIHTFISLIEKRLKETLNPEVTEWLGLIKQTCQRSTDLIRDFVNQEFLESVSVEVSKERLDLVWEINQMIDIYIKSEKVLAKEFIFTSSHPQVYAEIDSLKFTQVINNLISNAIKFTHDQGVISVHIEQKQPADEKPGTVLISVKDNGIGIPRKLHPYLFDKFTKARRPGIRGEESVGLGMSIIKTIVEWHNGVIWFDSEENQGTVFYIEIPQNGS